MVRVVACAWVPSAETPMSNQALNLASFGRWTLRDKAAQRRLALRYTDRAVSNE